MKIAADKVALLQNL